MSPVGFRKAATLLAALHPTDRRWLLKRLPDLRSTEMAALMRRAKGLVAPLNGELAGLWADECDLVVADVPPPDLLIGVLDAESEVWAARMLQAAAPDHAEMYLASCDRQRAQAIRTELTALSSSLPSGLARCLARHVADGARALSAEAA